MQFDPTKGTPIPASSKADSLKRSFAQQATASAFKLNSKVPRVSDAQSPSTSMQASSSRTLSPSFEIPQSSGKPPRSSKSSFKGSFGLRSSRTGLATSSNSRLHTKGGTKKKGSLPQLDAPLHDKTHILKVFNDPMMGSLKSIHLDQPKSSLHNFAAVASVNQPSYQYSQGYMTIDGVRKELWRTTATFRANDVVYEGIGDDEDKKASEQLAALSVVFQLRANSLLDNPKRIANVDNPPQGVSQVILSDGTRVTYEQARNFMDYYCRRYGFGKPDLVFEEQAKRKGNPTWEAVMTVGGRRIGLGKALSKKDAQINCYLDVTQYLEDCDPELWKTFVEAAKVGADLGMAPKVFFHMSDGLDDEIRDLCQDIKKSDLYRNRPAIGSHKTGSDTPDFSTPSIERPVPPLAQRRLTPELLSQRSQALFRRRQEYLANPRYEQMRQNRMSLPVYLRSEDVLSHIRDNDVTICMAATGSGKTTQIPQLILDYFIEQGQGAACNIVCTQPRRLAALSVADRVAKERGETLGKSVGYQVRFEAKLPEEHGSITFCTTGVFLKRLQSALSDAGHSGSRSLDDVTHVVVDEVHERDVDTDLLLVVLKRLLADRKARNKPFKIILMSATIDPTLFQNYFPDDNDQPASVTEIPGRSFPVTKYFLGDYVPQLVTPATRWVFNLDSVTKYLERELGSSALASLGMRTLGGLKSDPFGQDQVDDLELPYGLIALTVSHVLQRTDSGHVLVFLPGWDDIVAVQRNLTAPNGSLGLNLADTRKYTIHLLHSTIPLSEQQVIFEPPPEGVRRIILATNIAETSITIPDVVYVVDTAKIKEQRYDPDRHMSSLVSAWVGSSNLNQRAGRAGRHRPGEYFGILGRQRAERLNPYQTVEMKRVDLSNVVMHVKALNFPGMAVEEVLAATIEPPAADRVAAALKDLHMVGALDEQKNLTALGRVLLQLPVEAQMGRLVLFGSFFRCLDQALTLAAILTNRDPFLSPMHLKAEAGARKNSWSPPEFRSDALAILRAYNAWWGLQSKGEYNAANRFCNDNFLAKPTLLMIQRIKGHLLQALFHAGVIDVSAGGSVERSARDMTVPSELDSNGDSLPLLAALIAIASQPKFAIRTGEKSYRTSQDKMTFIHPSSVNHRKREIQQDTVGEKQLFAFAEKRQNISVAGSGSAQTFLMTTTRLDPMTYMLFGAYNLQVTERGLECDGWLPIVGNLDALDDVQRLKTLMESCMLRVFEGITMGRRQRNRNLIPIQPREEESESEDEDYERKDYSMSLGEIKELDLLTRDIVRILNRYSDERIATQSRQNSRPATPINSPSSLPLRLPGTGGSSWSGPSSAYNSRPGTPSRLSRKF